MVTPISSCESFSHIKMEPANPNTVLARDSTAIVRTNDKPIEFINVITPDDLLNLPALPGGQQPVVDIFENSAFLYYASFIGTVRQNLGTFIRRFSFKVRNSFSRRTREMMWDTISNDPLAYVSTESSSIITFVNDLWLYGYGPQVKAAQFIFQSSINSVEKTRIIAWTGCSDPSTIAAYIDIPQFSGGVYPRDLVQTASLGNLQWINIWVEGTKEPSVLIPSVVYNKASNTWGLVRSNSTNSIRYAASLLRPITIVGFEATYAAFRSDQKPNF